jgi:hypothetical protein
MIGAPVTNLLIEVGVIHELPLPVTIGESRRIGAPPEQGHTSQNQLKYLHLFQQNLNNFLTFGGYI